MVEISPEELKALAILGKEELSVIKKEKWLSWAEGFLLPEIDELLKNTVKSNPNSLSATTPISLREEKDIKPYMFLFLKENLPGYKLVYNEQKLLDTYTQEYFFSLTISWE